MLVDIGDEVGKDQSTSGLKRTRPSTSSTFSMVARSAVWNRLRPVTMASNPTSARLSGTTLRKWQHASGSRLQSVPSGSWARRSSGCGPDGANIGEAQRLLDPVAVAHRLAEQLVRVEEQDRRCRIDLGDLVQQHHGFRGKRGNDRDLSGERFADRELQQLSRVQVLPPARCSTAIPVARDTARLGNVWLSGMTVTSHPLDLTSARVRSDTPPGSMPAARQSDRERAISSMRSPHSGPKLVLELLAEQAGQPGRLPAGGDREQQIAAPDGCRHVEVAEIGLVLDIDEHTGRAGRRRQLARLAGIEPRHEQHGEAGQLVCGLGALSVENRDLLDARRSRPGQAAV